MDHITQSWMDQFIQKEAFWKHDGNPLRPHALLTRSKHSSGFFNAECVMEDPTLLDTACFDLVNMLQDAGLDLTTCNKVVGPAMGAITLTHSLAAAVNFARPFTDQNSLNPNHCLRAYTEKAEGPHGRFVMEFRRTTIRKGEVVLLTEDTLTTGGSVDDVATAVVSSGGVVLPFVAVLVNRSGKMEVSGRKIVALVDHYMPTWHPDECPLCKAGSKAVYPKENWALLNAEYK
jgi:orotate phosphoribosyltransferase